MKNIFVVLLVTLSLTSFAKEKISFKFEYSENPHALPEEAIDGLNVRNIDKGVLSAKTNFSSTWKGFKFKGINFIPDTSFSVNYLLKSELNNRNDIVNNSGANDQLRSLKLTQSLLGAYKLSKNMVWYGKLSLAYGEGFSVDYHFTEQNYHLLNEERLLYGLELGLQSRLSKKTRFNFRYKVSLADYKHNYSIYSQNSGRSNDNLSNLLEGQFNFKLKKNWKSSLTLSSRLTLYKEKWALNSTGLEFTEGEVEPEKLIDYKLAGSLTYKKKKRLEITGKAQISKREDDISGARDNLAYRLSLSSKLGIMKASDIKLGLSFEDKKYDNRIAPFVNTAGAPKLESESLSFNVEHIYKLKKGLKASFSYRHKNTHSNRKYDKIKDNILALGLNSTF